MNVKNIITPVVLSVLVVSSRVSVLTADIRDVGQMKNNNYYETNILKYTSNAPNSHTLNEVINPIFLQEGLIVIKPPEVSLRSETLIPQKNKEIEIPFTQSLDTTNQQLYSHDLVIKQVGLTNSPTLNHMTDYTTRVEGNKNIVTFLVDYTDEYSVKVKNPSFIRSNGNLALSSEQMNTPYK
ncbi:hypothetical protein [Paenibacillus taichungensis]|uniref:hypothetical protein n=2 Tax=Paenibacillus TaxID=44249 RepID=UPI0038CF9B7D